MLGKSIFLSSALVFNRNCLIKFSTTKSSIKLNSTMKTLISSDHHEKALDLFEKHSQHRTDRTYTLALKAATKLQDYQRGIDIHRQMKQQFLTDPFIQTSLIHLYMQCSRVEQANQIFSESSQKTQFMYGAMMKGYMTNSMPEKVIELYKQIQIEPDEVMLTLLFNACGQILTEDSIELGQGLIQTLPPSLFKHKKLMNSSIDMLMKFHDVGKAEQLFHQAQEKDHATYVVMINGYFLNNLSDKALNLFNQIRSKSSEFLYSTMFNGLASTNSDKSIMTGQQILRQMPKKHQNDTVVNNSIIKMYMKFNRIQEAEEIFLKSNTKNVQTYGLMMRGYNENNLPAKSLSLFKTMQIQSIGINRIIALLLIRACSSIGIRSISESIIEEISHVKLNLTLQNALVDLWAKSGDIEQARRIFESITEPDVVSFNCMINGYARNGMGAEAIDCYKKMPSNIRDNISHICVLNACSHSGLLEQAQTIYRDIQNKTSDIIATMVDCLSRMALFDQAESLINEYEKLHGPSLIMYTALLSGARNHRQAEISQKIYDRMKTLFSDKKSDMISASILLSNTYASIGDQQKANNLRSDRIKEFGKKVQVGSSWTVVNGQLYTFIAHDRSHPRSNEIYAELERLSNELKENGHSFDSSWITRPLEDGETVESTLCGHSERLAIAFNFIQNTKPSFIQITQNLRICGDCHNATKLIARTRNCEIIVRDSNRIHHFSINGQCSCRDHF